MKAIGTFLTTLALAVTLSGAVSAKGINLLVNCNPKTQTFKHFIEKKQAPSAWGVSESGKVTIHLWRNHDGSAFTVIATTSDGISCVLAAGKDWNSMIWHLKPKGPAT